MNKKILAILLLIETVAGLLAGSAIYATFSDVAESSGNVFSAGTWTPYVEIGSYKVLYPGGYDEQMKISDQLLSDNQVLQITIEGTIESWYMWVGLLITNDGILTAQVTTPSYEYILDSTDIQSYFTTTTYFYGAFDEGDFNTVWNSTKIEDLPHPETTDPPVTLETSQKAVIWTKITFGPADPTMIDKTIQIHIDIT